MWRILIFLLSLLVGCSSTPNFPESPTIQKLTISRHVDASLTEAEADAILAEMTEIARTRDSGPDVACNVIFQREGPIRTFSVGDGTIETAGEFAALGGVPGDIKVVNFVLWCSMPTSSTIGCARTPGQWAVVTRTPFGEGILWLHEWLHTKGHGHRDQSGAVMRPVISIHNRGIDGAECSSLH